MKQKISIFIIAILLYNMAFAQFFYNDVLATKQTNQQYRLLISNKTKKITAISKDADNTISQDFSVMQEIFGDKIVTTSNISPSQKSVATATYLLDKITASITESGDINTTIQYEYDANNNLTSITSTTTDTSVNSVSVETHIWQYTNNTPTQMLKIKNMVDTLFVGFVLDEKGLVLEENWKKNGKLIEAYSFYYDDKNQLTDIVRYNKNAKRALPDFVFTYADDGKIKTMLQVPTGTSNYNTWYYYYNDKGLKTKEICYLKKAELLGSIEYNYHY